MTAGFTAITKENQRLRVPVEAGRQVSSFRTRSFAASFVTPAVFKMIQPQIHRRSSDAWRARLDLNFEARGGRTLLAARAHHGPLRVQRPFYPEGEGVCHVYILHPPGGMVGGDELVIDVAVGAGASVLLTTPAAGKFYRSNGAVARQSHHLRVAQGAMLEWLPQEGIVFDGAHAELSTRVELAEGAGFIGWEILCLGRPGAGERFTHGALRQRVELWREGMPLYIERARYEEGAAALTAPWGLAGCAVSGSLWCVCDGEELLARVREAVAPAAGLFSATRLDGVLLCRYLGDHADEARRCFETVWQVLRPALLQRSACAPRIWAT